MPSQGLAGFGQHDRSCPPFDEGRRGGPLQGGDVLAHSRLRHQEGCRGSVINVKLIENVFTPDQKQEVVRRLTDAMVSIEGENMRSVTWVVVEEVASGDWGIGGQPLTTQDVKALAAGGAAVVG
jgi:4-oxalocrotonate tautomerase